MSRLARIDPPTGRGRLSLRLAACIVACLPAVSGVEKARGMDFVLPTPNRGILKGGPSFYMYTNRSFEGTRSTPWQAGMYGFVRNPKRTSAGIVYTKFHEGIDIKPVRRSSSGEPLDSVHSIATGKVAYVNARAGASNYGYYVVVRHDWGEGPFYSLYAHLKSTVVKAGSSVSRGQKIGQMGYTGRGIDRTRSHVHFEVNLMTHEKFPKWHDRHFRSPNHHGLHNGLNLVGLDAARLYAELRRNPSLTMAGFLRQEPIHYKVTVPNKGRIDLTRRYPWMAEGGGRGGRSWEIAFNRSGTPLRIRPSTLNVNQPAVTWVKPSRTYHSNLTKGYLTGSGSKAALSASGSRYIQLLTGTF